MNVSRICAMFLMIAFVSFLGFLVENIWMAVTKGYMDNRNMVFPFLIGYGLAIFAIYLLFGTPEEVCILGKPLATGSRAKSYGIYFLLVMVCISVGEIILGTIVEKTCHFYWWDYTDLPLHITRYTSIPTSAAFTTLIVVFMGEVFLPMYSWFLSWEKGILIVSAVGSMTLMLGDYLYSAYRMYSKKEMYHRWQIEVKRKRVYG